MAELMVRIDSSIMVEDVRAMNVKGRFVMNKSCDSILKINMMNFIIFDIEDKFEHLIMMQVR